ncbi:arabinosyltransferase C [Rhodococcus sp. 27YEA15]|uniref:arabinosyltransferase domain-containing protein n=1 Tax=Rhodococcus sp. 27YEA15 TaxID=3156259 RepID=UPI003C7CC025
MTDSAVTTAPASDAPPPGRSPHPRARIVAIVASILGIVLCASVPILPVVQDTATIAWPRNGDTTSVTAPLVSYTPLRFEAALPCASIDALADTGGTVASTAPTGAGDARRYGFVASVSAATTDQPARLDVVLRDTLLLSTPVNELSPGCSVDIVAEPTVTTFTVSGAEPRVLDGDFRPQVVGVFSDAAFAAPGLDVTIEPDSRFTSSPSALKLLVMVVGVLTTIVSLIALHRLDSLDGRRTRKFLPARWWKFSVVDSVVIGTLVLWHFIGATTTDDGYQFTMARASEHSGYMANYFRWFGVPETPFGTPYYDILGLLAHVTTASPWVRLPALLAGILAWMVISREVAPRLGAAMRGNRLALWTGALVFLAFWLPYNNGLRPEPIVALGVLLTWCSVERAIATRRLLPVAVAILIAGFTLTAGPSGLICFAALIAGIRPIIGIVVERARSVGFIASVGPLIAAGLSILIPVFADQPLATVFEMQRVHSLPPNQPWFDEYLRYQYLLNDSVDGSVTRRFGVFVLVLCLAVCITVMLRKSGRIPGVPAGPPRRIIGAVIGGAALLMFSPTKWTHHFGIFAGLASVVAMMAAVAVGATLLRSARNRALFAAAILFLLALAFTGRNGYYYVSSYSVPWWDKPVSISGLGASTVLLGSSVLMLGLAAWFFFREPYAGGKRTVGARRARILAVTPLTVAAAAMVLFEVMSMAKGTITQYPAFSVGRANVDAVLGEPCGLANDVLVEPDPNASMLTPLSGDRASALAAGGSTGFDPNGVAGDLRADKETVATGGANTVDTDQDTAGNSAGTGGGAGQTGVNGSSVALPFGLNPATTPVMGSYRQPVPGSLTSGWYQLPDVGANATRGDIVSIAAAGRIRSVDKDGIVTYGQNVEVEYGTARGSEPVEVLGRLTPIDIGPTPSWRNLRVPLSDIPVEANSIRIVVATHDNNPDQWVAVTPPRVPKTEKLQDVVGSQTPVMLDWAVGLQFPCQRPFDHRVGIAEIPEYRILPDHSGALVTSAWQDHFGGGPLGWIDLLLDARTLPSYLDNDWARDWGSIEKYSPRDPAAVPAQLDEAQVRRSGTWNPGPMTMSFP